MNKIPLKIITDAMEMADDGWNQYLDIEKMEVVGLPDETTYGRYDDDMQKLSDELEEGFRERYFRLPSRFDIHEYSIMERFVWNVPMGKAQSALENSIHGRWAFRRFRDALDKFGLTKEWYDFREMAYRRIAFEWCEMNGLEYADDESETSSGEDAGKDPLEWEEISTEHIVQDEWIDFRRSAYRFPDGRVFEPFYTYSRRDYVVIVASDTEGRYLCVRQFRQGIKQVTTEFVAGGIERNDGREYGKSQDISSEEALSAAKRELLEETGYESDEWKHLITVPSNATIADNYAHIFMARNCRKVSGQALDDTEFLNVKTYSASEIEELIKNGRFQQAMHIMAWLLATGR